MTDNLHVDLGRLPLHAAEHQGFAASWQAWPEGGEEFVASMRQTHGIVAEPLARFLATLQGQRRQFATDQSDAHQSVSDAITQSLAGFRRTEANSSDSITSAVRGL